MYVSYLAESGLKHSTIKVALGHMQIASKQSQAEKSITSRPQS